MLAAPLLLLTAGLLAAPPSSAAPPAAAPSNAAPSAAPPPTAHQTGAYNATLVHRSPDSAIDKLAFRYGVPPHLAQTQDYRLADETTRIVVPPDYDPRGQPHGLLVWVSPSDSGAVPAGYADTLAAQRLIWVSVHRTGNQRPILQRLGLAIDAAFNAPLYYHIDPERVYIAGLSGGGRTASRLAVNHAELFRGALPIIGCDYFRTVETPHRPGRYWRGFHPPTKRSLRTARQQPLVILTGSQDGNREQCAFYARAYEQSGFQAVTYTEVPGMGHTFPTPQVFADALTQLDQRPEPTAQTLKRHAIGQKHLHAALAQPTTDAAHPTADPAADPANPAATLKALRRVALRYDDTPAGRQARLTADRLEFGAEAPPVAADTDTNTDTDTDQAP